VIISSLDLPFFANRMPEKTFDRIPARNSKKIRQVAVTFWANFV